jgi:hypothetical protein
VTSEPSAFDTAAVAAIERRFAMLANHERPILWQHATLPQFEPLRAWLHQQLANLETQVARGFTARLRDADRYTQALAELATGYLFDQPGYEVHYEPQLGRLTPDLLVTAPDGYQLVVEVWRRGLPQATNSRNKRWADLARHVRRIRQPVALALSSQSHEVVEPPDAPTRRRIEQALRAWLSSEQTSTIALHIDGLTFRVVGTTTTGRAEILPVQDGATADRKDVVEAIERKVRRYRSAVEDADIPLLVVLSADPSTALDAELVGSILDGNNPIAMRLPVYGVGRVDSGPIEIRTTNAPPVFDRALSGVAWLEINDGAHAELHPYWPNPDAARPITLQRPAD